MHLHIGGWALFQQTKVLFEVGQKKQFPQLGIWQLSNDAIPLLAPQQGGVAERSLKCREASDDREDGVVF
jgi:hypothetical protein